jgi:cell wall-associated NlpC family hydrolase
MDRLELCIRKIILLPVIVIIAGCSSSVKFADKSTDKTGAFKPAPVKQVKNAPPVSRDLSAKIERKKPADNKVQVQPEPQINDLEKLRESIIEHANEWLGVPYRWGGNSRSGVDCSGLIVEVFKKESYLLPRTAAAQFHYLEIVDDMENLKIGDLVFFSYTGTQINHVGIYSGYGRMIHASSSRGVVEDTFLVGFFSGKFAGGGVIA